MAGRKAFVTLTGMKTFVCSIYRTLKNSGAFSVSSKEFLTHSEAKRFGYLDSTITKITKRDEFDKEIVIYLKEESSHPTYENITKIEDTCFDRCSLCGACVAYMDYDRDNALNLHTKWHIEQEKSNEDST